MKSHGNLISDTLIRRVEHDVKKIVAFRDILKLSAVDIVRTQSQPRQRQRTEPFPAAVVQRDIQLERRVAGRHDRHTFPPPLEGKPRLGLLDILTLVGLDEFQVQEFVQGDTLFQLGPFVTLSGLEQKIIVS